MPCEGEGDCPLCLFNIVTHYRIKSTAKFGSPRIHLILLTALNMVSASVMLGYLSCEVVLASVVMQ